MYNEFEPTKPRWVCTNHGNCGFCVNCKLNLFEGIERFSKAYEEDLFDNEQIQKEYEI